MMLLGYSLARVCDWLFEAGAREVTLYAWQFSFVLLVHAMGRLCVHWAGRSELWWCRSACLTSF
jgi:hypothetical protein